MDTAYNLEKVLDWYSEHLRTKHPKNSKRFERARKSELEAAIAEAVTFHLLTYMGVHPEINEQVGIGGADFICCASRTPFSKRLPQNQFVVEATSFDQDAVSTRSRIPKVIPAGISGGAIGLLTQNICNKATKKISSLKATQCPAFSPLSLAIRAVQYFSTQRQQSGLLFLKSISFTGLGVLLRTPPTTPTLRTQCS